MSEFKEYHNANHHDGDDTFDDQTYKMTNGEDFDDQFVQDCFDHFKVGQQSQQAKIDDLQGRIDGALEKCYTGIRKQGGDHYLELVEDILKGNKDEN